MADPLRYLRTSALSHLQLLARARQPENAGITMRERPFRGQLALRGEGANARFVAAAGNGLGFDLPVEPNTAAGEGGITALWLGPSEWLLVMPGEAAAHMATLREALAGTHHAVTDVSESRAVIGLAGPAAREVLAKGCSLDLHPRLFGPGRCAQSLMARCHMLLHQLDDRPSYDIYVHRSFAEYAWRWLEDAGAEYGVAIGSG